MVFPSVVMARWRAGGGGMGDSCGPSSLMGADRSVGERCDRVAGDEVARQRAVQRVRGRRGRVRAGARLRRRWRRAGCGRWCSWRGVGGARVLAEQREREVPRDARGRARGRRAAAPPRGGGARTRSRWRRRRGARRGRRRGASRGRRSARGAVERQAEVPRAPCGSRPRGRGTTRSGRGRRGTRSRGGRADEVVDHLEGGAGVVGGDVAVGGSVSTRPIDTNG
jgi:hypothetical protein